MKKSSVSFLLTIGLIGVASLACSEPVKKSTNLDHLLQVVDQNPESSRDFVKLDVDWVGEIKNCDGDISHLRLEKGGVKNGRVVLARIEPDGNFAVSDKAHLVDAIPTSSDLNQISSVAELEQKLGKGQRSFETWTGANGQHYFLTWVCIAKSASGKLDYIKAKAEVSSGVESDGKVERIVFCRGNLRPAKKGSDIEKIMYLTGEQIYQARRKDLASTDF